MASFNKVILMGNLTRDPELRVTPRGTPICSFGLAVNRKYRDESQQLREEVNFFDLEAWGKTGEIISKYMKRGDPLLVEGRLKYDQWEDKNTGQKRSKIKIIVETSQFIGGRNAGTTPGASGGYDQQQQGGGGGGGTGDTGEYGAADQPPVERHTPPPRPPTRPAPSPAAPPASSAPPAPPGNIAEDDVPF
ncbi:MAG: single-stranded DNA-binding protein [Opitutaceae bacterium]|jgi:single-strand DNA-binding protein|nr:single-stranded DNA-binding protein [Opitutaceae bacterium]